MVNTELPTAVYDCVPDYNILNIVVNTERGNYRYWSQAHYNILNIVVNTELRSEELQKCKIITY